MMVMAAATLLAAALLSSATTASAAPSAAAQPYDPPTWQPIPGHNVTTVKWGPITIPAAPETQEPPPGHDHGHGPAGELKNEVAVDGTCSIFVELYSGCREMKIQKPCEDCYITGILPDLVIAGTDTSVNIETGGMLHHVVNMNISRKDPLCGPGLGKHINMLGLMQGGNERFFAAGNERTFGSVHSSGQYGYRVNAGDKWGLVYHLMNHTHQPLTVEFKYTFTWVKSAKQAHPYWLDIDQCGNSEKEVPAGYSDTHYEARLWRRGTVLSLGGHGHDGILGVSLENASNGKWYCTSIPGYEAGTPHGPAGPGAGTPGHPAEAHVLTRTGHPNAPLSSYHKTVANFTTCEPDMPIAFFDKVRMHTTYNMRDVDPGAMGIMVVYIA
ncbi:hypothetical protein DPM19_03060 [Actinomadura craniellae]|uniref:Uncharacterized protein n=2 Tax=Actinomadura craniellae TaxID=2231787 RepID=A0A365HDE4_9ACTN|nr:hypothetical protein DPM19_03060 [Actinomadura craniellae]